MSDGAKFIPLPQGAGYGVVVGLGLFFALTMMAITFMLKRYNKEMMTAEEFSTAGRSVKKYLICACVVSSWTWSATLLTSTTQTYSNGVMGAYAYAAGATWQIVMFSCVAMKAKFRAPSAHTYLEIIKYRYGKVTHIVFCIWGLITNIMVTVMLLTGTSAVLNDMTGMHVIAACLLLPLGVMVYTLFGGLKSTFITDYTHGVIVVIVMFTFAFVAWATDDVIGSPDKVWDILQQVAIDKPRSGNADGSYLTMRSQHGGIFFVINIVGGTGTVFLDNAYFNKAFAANPSAAMPGYILGGLSWFAVPFFTATTLGLGALCLENTPAWPTYPEKLTQAQVDAGLVLPNAAYALLGENGAMASLLIVFFAATSAMSSELISVSSIVTYDFYREYINPQASGKKLMTVSHITVAAYAYILAGFAIGLYYAGISMGYLYELMGMMIGAAVIPSALTLLTKKQNYQAAAITPPFVTLVAIMGWLLVTKTKYGEVNVATTFSDDAMLTGNVIALLGPLVTVPILTFVFKPQNFDWEILKQIRRVEEEEEILEAEGIKNSSDDDEKKLATENVHPITSQATQAANEIALINEDKYYEETKRVYKQYKYAVVLCVFLTISLLVLWPMPMYGSSYIFSKPFFRGWIVVGFIWSCFTAFTVVIGPLWESRQSIALALRGMYWDLTGQSYKVKEWQNSHPEQLHVVTSQVNAQLSARSGNIVEGKTIDGTISNDELKSKV